MLIVYLYVLSVLTHFHLLPRMDLNAPCGESSEAEEAYEIFIKFNHKFLWCGKTSLTNDEDGEVKRFIVLLHSVGNSDVSYYVGLLRENVRDVFYTN